MYTSYIQSFKTLARFCSWVLPSHKPRRLVFSWRSAYVISILLTWTKSIRAFAGQHNSPEKLKKFFRANKKRRKITWPWNIGHCDLNLFWGQRPYYTDSFSKSMTFIYQILFTIQGKITWPWKNRLLSPTFFFGQRLHHYDSLSHSMVIIHQILFKI